MTTRDRELREERESTALGCMFLLCAYLTGVIFGALAMGVWLR